MTKTTTPKANKVAAKAATQNPLPPTPPNPFLIDTATADTITETLKDFVESVGIAIDLTSSGVRARLITGTITITETEWHRDAAGAATALVRKLKHPQNTETLSMYRLPRDPDGLIQTA